MKSKPTCKFRNFKIERNKSEVEKELKTCNMMLHFQNFLFYTDVRKHGNLEISDDKSLEEQGFRDLGEGRVEVYSEYWRALVADAELMKQALPPEQRQVLDHPRDLARLDGAACAMQWLLGHHNEELAAYLISDRYGDPLARNKI